MGKFVSSWSNMKINILALTYVQDQLFYYRQILNKNKTDKRKVKKPREKYVHVQL